MQAAAEVPGSWGDGIVGSIAVLICCSALGLLGCSLADPNAATEVRTPVPSRIDYWDQQRKGANSFNEALSKQWFESASRAGIGLVRLAYGKWESERRDFLLGDAGGYTGIVEADLARLLRALDDAEEAGIKAVVVPLSLPGARFRQFNGGHRDGRLWTDEAYLSQAVRFWGDLALRLRDHPAVVAYDLLNEPHPEWFHGKRTFWNRGFGDWYGRVRGGPGDLNRFHRAVAGGIRGVDAETPLIVEAGLYATPWAFEYLLPLDDDKVLYSFHMYEPYEYTTRRINEGRYSYPGPVSVGDAGEERTFDAEAIDAFLQPVRDWSERHGVPPSRIFAAEFGCDRTVSGAAGYLADLIRVFNREDWHWAFYAYREDSWASMDYELGTDRAGESYWAAVESGTLPQHYEEIYGPRKNNPLWAVLRTEFAGRVVSAAGQGR